MTRKRGTGAPAPLFSGAEPLAPPNAVSAEHFSHSPTSAVPKLRLVTWNCCCGPFSKKVPLLDLLMPDIAVIQECPRPATTSDQRL